MNRYGEVIGYWWLCALREERDMEKRFPESYREYRTRTKMAVPFLL